TNSAVLVSRRNFIQSIAVAGAAILASGCASPLEKMLGEWSTLSVEEQRKEIADMKEAAADFKALDMKDLLTEPALAFLETEARIARKDALAIRTVMTSNHMDAVMGLSTSAATVTRVMFKDLTKKFLRAMPSMKDEWQKAFDLFEQNLFADQDVVILVNQKWFDKTTEDAFRISQMVHEAVHWAQFGPRGEKAFVMFGKGMEGYLGAPVEQEAYGLQMLYLAEHGKDWITIATWFAGNEPSGKANVDGVAAQRFEQTKMGRGLKKIWVERVEPKLPKAKDKISTNAAVMAPLAHQNSPVLGTQGQNPTAKRGQLFNVAQRWPEPFVHEGARTGDSLEANAAVTKYFESAADRGVLLRNETRTDTDTNTVTDTLPALPASSLPDNSPVRDLPVLPAIPLSIPLTVPLLGKTDGNKKGEAYSMIAFVRTLGGSRNAMRAPRDLSADTFGMRHLVNLALRATGRNFASTGLSDVAHAFRRNGTNSAVTNGDDDAEADSSRRASKGLSKEEARERLVLRLKILGWTLAGLLAIVLMALSYDPARKEFTRYALFSKLQVMLRESGSQAEAFEAALPGTSFSKYELGQKSFVYVLRFRPENYRLVLSKQPLAESIATINAHYYSYDKKGQKMLVAMAVINGKFVAGYNQDGETYIGPRPNGAAGALLIVTKDRNMSMHRADIRLAQKIDAKRSDFESVVQAGPMSLQNGQIVESGVLRQRLGARSFVAEHNDGSWALIFEDDMFYGMVGNSILETTQFLQKLGFKSAMVVDAGSRGTFTVKGKDGVLFSKSRKEEPLTYLNVVPNVPSAKVPAASQKLATNPAVLNENDSHANNTARTGRRYSVRTVFGAAIIGMLLVAGGTAYYTASRENPSIAAAVSQNGA
ncbi:MAG TPA: phosphodiester glycosidase family protein, partial [Candidatus Omnitrophota bacterium]|nr:phosphodiester glycosidase family protein [Candidatus Omnitrophota bacterium]